MNWSFMFFINSVFLGVGLAMDAFSVSIANALTESDMKKSRAFQIVSVYAIFQFAMPMIGWICVHTIATAFTSFQKFIPWIALILLLYIGGKMIIESLVQKKKVEEENKEESEGKAIKRISFGRLMIQGIATSIDALSVGFTIAEYKWPEALTSSLIIAAVTFGICSVGIFIGKKIGSKIESKANILGGLILIAIGIEIFVKGVFF